MHLTLPYPRLSLAEGGVDDLVVRLGGDPPSGDQEALVSPIRYYIIPPVSARRLVGDLLHGTIDGIEDYWVLLTPSCDLARDPVKAEWVLLAPCDPLIETVEYKEWTDNQARTRRTL